MLNVAAYTRSSALAQSTTSLESQTDICAEIAQKHLNAEVLHLFSDSLAADDTARPGLQALLDAARAGTVNAIVVSSFDRLMRGRQDAGLIFQLVRDTNVRIVTQDGEFEIASIQLPAPTAN